MHILLLFFLTELEASSKSLSLNLRFKFRVSLFYCATTVRLLHAISPITIQKDPFHEANKLELDIRDGLVAFVPIVSFQ